jgi:hypothetical protein
VLIGVPPVDRLLFLRGLPAMLAARHAEFLNRASISIAASRQRVRFLPFVPPAESDGERHRSAKTYAEWAAVIAPSVVAALSRGALGTRS